jgi:hypothetical protein
MNTLLHQFIGKRFLPHRAQQHNPSLGTGLTQRVQGMTIPGDFVKLDKDEVIGSLGGEPDGILNIVAESQADLISGA